MRPTVIVLMSTYNGEAHLEEQIKSILNQEGVKVRLVIRDDGSTDGTVDIAREFTNDVIVGKNIGYRYSFLELIRDAPDADFYALSDQDDIWLPEKLMLAVTMINGKEDSLTENQPILYASARHNYINGNIEQAKELIAYKETSFNGFDNGHHLQGCTMVFNFPLKTVLSSYLPHQLITSHDVWIHQLCKAIGGEVIYDARETSSMVCLESLLAGTSVVGFECGGPESVFGNYSIFVKYGDLKALKEAVDKALTNNNSNSQAIRDKFSSRKMAVEYISLYESLL